MLVPCRHIFAVRKLLDAPLFDPLLPNKKWTENYNKLVGAPASAPEENNETEVFLLKVAISTSIPKNIVTYGQKRRDILKITDSLADLAAQTSNMLFERRKSCYYV